MAERRAMRTWRLYILSCLVIVTLLTGAALALRLDRVQADIAARVDAELVADGQSWASAEISGRTARVMGTAPTVVAQRLAVESADRVWGVAFVVDGSGLLPLQRSYRWSAELQPDKVVVSGYVPSEDERLAILAAIAHTLPDRTVEDSMELARGQPVNFLGLVRFLVDRLVELQDGSVSLAGPAITIAGTARGEAEFNAAARALSSMVPASAELRNIRILPPRTERFEWRLDYDGKKAVMSGFVPSVASARDIGAALRATLPDVTLEDSTGLASGAPAGFTSAAIFAAYQLAHLTEGSAAMDGPVLNMVGKAKSVADYEQALAEITARQGRQTGGIGFGSVDIVPAAVDPYVWRAERAGGRVTLTGYVPTIEARNLVLQNAAELFDGIEVSDHLRVADGDPKMDWIGAIAFGLGQLARLDKGTVSLTGRNYDIAGEALSTEAYLTLRQELGRTLPASMELRHSAVAPAAISPFLFAVVRGAGSVSFTGYVPTDEVAEQIVGAAKPKFGSDAFDIRLQLAGGVPDGFVAAVSAGLQAVSRLEGGRLDVVDRKLSVSGVAVSETARSDIERTLRAAMPENFELASSMIVAVGGDPLTAPDCQTALRAEIGRDQVQFESGSAVVSPDSYGLIDRLAAIAQRCPAATIEVAGHTDSAGGSRKNQAISEERAAAVIDLLVQDGVRRERLTAIGYGQSRPIASNSTAAGRAQNRRIEFNVVGQ